MKHFTYRIVYTTTSKNQPPSTHHTLKQNEVWSKITKQPLLSHITTSQYKVAEINFHISNASAGSACMKIIIIVITLFNISSLARIKSPGQCWPLLKKKKF
jgi:hypothetical protein